MREAERLIIEGRVQGVGFRWWTAGEASRLQLDGWVRNRADGSVEVLAIGHRPGLDRLAALCAAGPPGARVDRVERQEAEDDGSTGFSQRPAL
jgi:acylphosphatase